jgi:hypothetical protein
MFELLKYSLPFNYLLNSRIKSLLERVSWVIIYFLPSVIVGLYYIHDHHLIYLLLYILAYITFNAVYEIGYMQNDVVTVRTESTPTYRLSLKARESLYKILWRVYFFRAMIALFLLFCMYEISIKFDVEIFISQFSFMLLLVLFIFSLHNNIRSRGNIVTFSLLSLLKFSIVLSLFFSFEFYIELLMCSVFVFPLLRSIEHSTKLKYGMTSLSRIVGSHNIFRLKYYILIFLLTLGIFILSPIESVEKELYVVIIFYFLLFRAGSYLLVKYGLYKRE